MMLKLDVSHLKVEKKTEIKWEYKKMQSAGLTNLSTLIKYF